MNDQSELRQHLLELLDGRSAHIDLATALRDILEFSRDASHVSPDFPDGYWNHSVAGAVEWSRSLEQVLVDLQSMRDLVSDETTDLFAKLPHGTGQTLLREVLVAADHNAYHLGQIMLIRRMLESK